MRSYVVVAKCSMVLAAACILACGCTDKKKIAELELGNQNLESRVAKLDSDLTLASNALRAKQAEVANLQTQLVDMQTKITEMEKKPATTATRPTATKSSTTAKKSPVIAKKSPVIAKKTSLIRK